MCLVFYLGSLIPGIWGESYVDGSETVINTALNHTFGGTWYVLLGSTIAFFVSAVVNNFVNWYIGRTIRKDQASPSMLQTYISTGIGQFVDNLIFRPHCQP